MKNMRKMRQGTRNIFQGGIVAVLFLIMTAASAFALVDATITVSPAAIEAGKTVAVEVSISPTSGPEKITGLDLYLSYDANIFNAPVITDYEKGTWDVSQVNAGSNPVKYTKAAFSADKGINLTANTAMYKLVFTVKPGAVLGNTSLVMANGFFNVIDENFAPITGKSTSGTLAVVNPIITLSPNSGNKGASGLVVTVTGQNTNFSSNSIVSFVDGTGITVTKTDFVSKTELKATINIAADATTGSNWDVEVKEGATVLAKGSNMFTVGNPLPGVPAGLKVNEPGPAWGTPSWNTVSGATTYRVQYGEKADFTGATEVTTKEPITWVTINGLKVDTTYYVRVRAENQYGNSAYSAGVSFKTSAVQSPANLEVKGISQTGATPSWDSSDGATGYTLSYGKDAAATDMGTVNPKVGETWITLLSLTPATKYYVKVRADNAGKASSSYTSIVSFTTLDKPASPPAVPQNLTVSGITQTTATASWDKVNDATSYVLIYSALINNVLEIKLVPTTETTVPLTGLIANTTYSVRVRAEKVGENPSADSDPVDFKTLPEGQVGLPEITSIGPKRGPIRTAITIKGANFGATALGRKVVFESPSTGMIIPVIAFKWTDNEIVVKVPPQLEAGDYKVTVSKKESINSDSNDDKIFSVVTMSTTAKVYPNPFNPLAGSPVKIEVVLNETTNVQVYLYDMTGQPVWKSGIKTLPAGANTIDWSGTTFFSDYAGDGIVLVRVLNEDSKTLISKGKILIIKQ